MMPQMLKREALGPFALITGGPMTLIFTAERATSPIAAAFRTLGILAAPKASGVPHTRRRARSTL